jgi:hypothetical protein
MTTSYAVVMSHMARLSRKRNWLLPVVAVASLAAWAWHERGPLPATIHPVPSATEAVTPRAAPLPNASGHGERTAVGMEQQRSIGSPVSLAPKPLTASDNAPALQANRFSLIGTTLSGDLRIALLRDNATGESREVVEAGRVDDMTVAVVGSDRVELRAGSQTEQLELRRLGDPPKTETQLEPSSSLGALPFDDLPAKHSDLASAPVTPSTEVDVGALIEDGKPVPNPS